MITVFDMSIAECDDEANDNASSKVVRCPQLSCGMDADALLMQRWQQTRLRLLTVDEAVAEESRFAVYRR